MHMVYENISCTKQQYMYFLAFLATSAKALTDEHTTLYLFFKIYLIYQ